MDIRNYQKHVENYVRNYILRGYEYVDPRGAAHEEGGSVMIRSLASWCCGAFQC